MMETTTEPPTETVVETPPEMVETPPETTDLSGGMVDIEDAMSTDGLRKIYWIPRESNANTIIRSNPDGSGQETIVSAKDGTNLYNVNDFVVDSEGGKLYWNSRDEDDGLCRVNLDGTNIEQVVTTG